MGYIFRRYRWYTIDIDWLYFAAIIVLIFQFYIAALPYAKAMQSTCFLCVLVVNQDRVNMMRGLLAYIQQRPFNGL